ncbi:23S rRNA (uracil(747)-C(5))-methyltransferase RlmC [Shewanella sp. YIC-542]|uniref:23S rRNA (uracil(747)-C(5))-methyltransferase RlmC n=1 Tax=Shewanella mytili TaxID=3377111 RepID=UPI00398F7A02
MGTAVNCHHFSAGRCLSCRHIQQPLATQLAAKQAYLQQLLAPFSPAQWLAPVQGAASAFRNKAKMVVLGSAHQPVLGIPGADGMPVNLCDCPLYPADMQQLLQQLTHFVQQAGVPPYRVDKAKGELKYILLTRAQVSGEFMLRFVLRSTTAIARIEKQLPQLLQQFPKIKIVTANLQPVHMARLEGEQEIWLAGAPRLREVFNDVPLYIRPKSFFQTNPQVAAALYQTASAWLAPIAPGSVWDLFCGVGGFGLHCATASTRLTGIEIEAEAIACARLSAKELGLTQVNFQALDSTDFAAGKAAEDVPDVIIVNPPRRGLGKALCQQLSAFAPDYLLYSSCNPKTLAEDLASIDGYRLQQVQLFDMFPHTDHFEVLALLRRTA